MCGLSLHGCKITAGSPGIKANVQTRKEKRGGEIQREKSTARDVSGFPGSSVVKNSPAMQETRCLIPGSERPPGVGHGSPIQYSCLENPMDRGAWRDTVHGVTKSRT